MRAKSCLSENLAVAAPGSQTAFPEITTNGRGSPESLRSGATH